MEDSLKKKNYLTYLTFVILAVLVVVAVLWMAAPKANENQAPKQGNLDVPAPAFINNSAIWDKMKNTYKPPTITKISGGYHYFSPVQGGYSFDYPDGWISMVDQSNDSSINTQIKVVSSNDLISQVLLENQKTNDTIAVAFSSDFSKAWIDEAGCNDSLPGLMLEASDAQYAGTPVSDTDLIRKQGVVREWFANATVEWISSGMVEGCAIKGRMYGEPVIAIMGGRCGNRPMMLMGQDEQVYRKLIAGLKCGPGAG